MEKNDIRIAGEYYNKVHFWGRFTLSLSILFFLGIGFYLSYVMDLHPGWEVIFTAFLGIAAMVGHTWLNVGDQIMYLLLMGPAATYMAALTGDIKNARLPSAMAACAMVTDSDGKMKKDILAAYGAAVSVVVNTIFMIILAVAGNFVLQILPAELLDGLNYIVPALFGALLAQFALRNVRVAALSLVIVLMAYHAAFIPSFLRTFVAIVVTIAASMTLHHGQKSKSAEEETPED